MDEVEKRIIELLKNNNNCMTRVALYRHSEFDRRHTGKAIVSLMQSGTITPIEIRGRLSYTLGSKIDVKLMTAVELAKDKDSAATVSVDMESMRSLDDILAEIDSEEVDPVVESMVDAALTDAENNPDPSMAEEE